MSNTNIQGTSQELLKYAVKDIKPEHFFSKPVFLDKQFILTSPEMPITQEMIKALTDWEFTEVYSAGEQLDEHAIINIDKAESEEQSKALSTSDREKIKRAEVFFADFAEYTENIYNDVTSEDGIVFNTIAEKMKEACEVIREERRFLLRIQKNILSNSAGNYLISHSVKSTIISIIIGLYLKLPNHRLIELGVAALLHEIGMVKLSPETYLSKRPLTRDEYRGILTHPILGYNILKAFGFPLTITLASLEHHERENGSGYPRKLTGERISLYAKIIAVACSYEALSAQRPHKEAKDGYTGMLELLKNEGKQYDDTIVRALVFSLSIYPIGLYVLLSSGQKGQVVDVNPEKPRFPIVQVFGELDQDGKNVVYETFQDGLTIVRPLTKEEIGQD